MDNQPSTSKSTQDDTTEPTVEALPPELNIASNEFDPVEALYANPELKLTKRKPKIIYQNMAEFEMEFSRKGLYGLPIKSSEKSVVVSKKSEAKTDMESSSLRRFLPHQMAIQTTGGKEQNQRNLLKQIENMEGPLAVLRDCMNEKQKVKVYTRSEHTVRGTISGYVISFDKHWNLLLRDVQETWKRRKYKYDENKFCGTPSDCSERLRQLGIILPETKVKSLNRKNVELSRSIAQLFIRGEEVVLVSTGRRKEGMSTGS